MPAATRPHKTRSSKKTGKVSRWGNSLGLRIPQEGVDRLQLRDGESVAFEISADRIIIRRAPKARKKWTEAELLKGVSPDKLDGEIWPVAVGREML